MKIKQTKNKKKHSRKNKTNLLTIRISDEDLKKIDKKSKKYKNSNRSDWVRYAAINHSY